MPTPQVASRLRQDDLRQSPIRKIMELADRKNIVNLGLDPDDVISFAGGWVNHRAPEALRDEYRKIAEDEALFHELGGYSPTRGIGKLRAMLLQLDAALYGTEGLGDEHLIIGASSTQLTFSLFVTLLDPGDRVLLFDPSYANFPPQLGLCQQNIEVLTLPVLDTDNWAFFRRPGAILGQLEEILERDRPRLLLFSSPDNPTGQLVPDGPFEQIVELAASADCFVAVDYAYRAQYFTDERPQHFAASPARHGNLIKIHSNSKWCRGLGRRLGWIEAAPEVVDALEIVQQSTALCPDSIHQAALANYLESALANGSLATYTEAVRADYGIAAERMSGWIEQYLDMPYLEPQGGLYTVVNVGGDGDRFVLDVLENTGVIFVPGSGFGTTLNDAIRVSFGPLVNDLERMEEAFARVRTHLDRRPEP